MQDAVVAEIMHLYIPETLICRATDEIMRGTPTFEIKDRFIRRDNEALRAAKIVRQEMRSPGFASSLLLDSIAMALAVHMVRQWSNLIVAPVQNQSGGLASWQLRKVKTIISDRLAEEVRLDDLAAALGLSTFHFARTFKQSTGIPPHRFQTLSRLESVREMLTQTSMSILDIALSAGYESGQALARAFKREFGCSPTEFRSQIS